MGAGVEAAAAGLDIAGEAVALVFQIASVVGQVGQPCAIRFRQMEAGQVGRCAMLAGGDAGNDVNRNRVFRKKLGFQRFNQRNQRLLILPGDHGVGYRRQ